MIFGLQPIVYTEGYVYIQTMVFAAVFAANFFNGLNTSAWTGWVFFSVFLGDVLVLAYTVRGVALDYFQNQISFLRLLGCLQCNSPFIVFDICLGQQQLFVQVGLLLALSSPHCPPFFVASVYLQSTEIRLSP